MSFMTNIRDKNDMTDVMLMYAANHMSVEYVTAMLAIEKTIPATEPNAKNEKPFFTLQTILQNISCLCQNTTMSKIFHLNDGISKSRFTKYSSMHDESLYNSTRHSSDFFIFIALLFFKSLKISYSSVYQRLYLSLSQVEVV